MDFPYTAQSDSSDCGVSSLKMVLDFYSIPSTLEQLRDSSKTTTAGTSIKGLVTTAEQFGLEAIPVRAQLEALGVEVSFPCILLWENNHFVVLISRVKNGFKIADPVEGIYTVSIEKFTDCWITDVSNQSNPTGISIYFNVNDTFVTDSLSKPSIVSRIARVLKTIIFIPSIITYVVLSINRHLLFILVCLTIEYIVAIKTIQNSQDLPILVLGYIFFAFLSTFLLIQNLNRIHSKNKVHVSDLKATFGKSNSFYNSKETEDVIDRIFDSSRIEEHSKYHLPEVIFQILNFLFGFLILMVVDFNVAIFYLFGIALQGFLLLHFSNKMSKSESEIYRKFQNLETVVRAAINNLESKSTKVNYDLEKMVNMELEYKNTRNSIFAFLHFKGEMISIFKYVLLIAGILIYFLNQNFEANNIGELFLVILILTQLNFSLSELVGFIKTLDAIEMVLLRKEDS